MTTEVPCAYRCPHDKAAHERYPNDIDHEYVSPFKGNHAVIVMPDGTMMDPLADGRKADPLQKAIRAALNELGVPQDGWPMPVVNAVNILTAALQQEKP